MFLIISAIQYEIFEVYNAHTAAVDKPTIHPLLVDNVQFSIQLAENILFLMKLLVLESNINL